VGLVVSKSKCYSYFRKNLDKVDWGRLSMNPNAIPILEQNLIKVNWYYLSQNPNIITYDYGKGEEKPNVILGH